MKIWVIVFLPLVFLTVSASCPTDLALCNCFEVDDYIEVQCIGAVITQADLKNVFNALDRTDEIVLVLGKVNLGSLPSNFFQGLNIIKIEIQLCQIESLASDGGKPFTGLENILGELDIVQTFTHDNVIQNLDLSHLEYLTDLDLTKNLIDQVDDKWFANGPKSLLQVILSNNAIGNLGNKAFRNLPMLDTLVVEGNHFPEQIQRNMFPNPAKTLETLELNNNGITNIPEDLFSNMPILKKLSLKGNGLVKIDERTYKPIWHQLKLVDIGENPLECDSQIDWIHQHYRKPEYIIGKCNSPEDKRDVQLEDLIR